MSKFYKGQKVKLSLPDKRYPTLRLGTEYIVNFVKPNYCFCNFKNDLIDIGIRTQTTRENFCARCNARWKDDIQWFNDAYFENAESATDSKYVVQVELLNLLADGKMEKSVYDKIMNMINGDEEMLILADRILKQMKNGFKQENSQGNEEGEGQTV